MKKTIILLLALTSISAFAEMQEIGLIGCQSEITVNRFNNIDQTTQDYIIRTRGVRCLPGLQKQCQQQQSYNHDRGNQIDIDETTIIFPGEAKIFNGKLITCH